MRDSRAVAFSKLRWVLSQPHADSVTYHRRAGIIKSTAVWNACNFATEVFWKKRIGHYLLVRYEDYVKRPEQTLSLILEMIKEPAQDFPFTGEHRVRLCKNHNLVGNRSRFRTGEIDLKRDDQWQTEMKALDRILATLLTFRMLKKYKYPLSISQYNNNL